ncbi:putative transposase [Yoonia maritima]|uniref:Putative transposase n=1 Tax=Yoonia maritima TaxID=1435347 RepID=A0A2T0VTK3_9RHOB|nr:DDE-type integrase/transposase/recombinase [Yoonia maritima]PRY74511.1 putative transposase [Yoonia maritima]
MTYHFRFGKSDMFCFSGVQYRPIEVTSDCVILERADEPGITEVFSHEELFSLVQTPEATFRPGYFDWSDRKLQSSVAFDALSVLDDKRKPQVLWRQAICDAYIDFEVRRLINRTEASFNEMKPQLEAEALRRDGEEFRNKGKRAGTDLRKLKFPCSKSVFNWVRTYQDSGYDPLSLIPKRHRSGNHGLRWCHETEAWISRVIETYADTQRPTKIAAIDATIAAIKKENERRRKTDEHPLHVPSVRAVRARLAQADPYYIHAKRYGIAAANKKFTLFETGVDVIAPMERVEMDECKLDIKSLLAATGILEHLAPERRVALEQGRRWICVAIDCATKSILALRISENPSADEAIRTLRDVYTDKTAIAQACDCESTWHQSGQIGLLAVDQGSAFASEAFQTAAKSLGIVLQFPPGGLPWLRGHIETFFRTLGHQLLPLLSGRTFFNPVERGDYPSEQLACLSDDDLIQVLITFVVDIYHNQPHGSLGGETPGDCWDRLVAVEGTPFTPDGHVMRKAFGRRFERQLRGDGVLFARTGYSCDALREAFLHSPERKVEICVDTRDLGWILVKVGGVWHAATANVSGLDGVSYEVLKEASRSLRLKFQNQAELNFPIIQRAISRISDTNRAAMIRSELTPFHVTDDEIRRNEKALHYSLRSAEEKLSSGAISRDPLADGLEISMSENQPEDPLPATDHQKPSRRSSWRFDDGE